MRRGGQQLQAVVTAAGGQGSGQIPGVQPAAPSAALLGCASWRLLSCMRRALGVHRDPDCLIGHSASWGCARSTPWFRQHRHCMCRGPDELIAAP